MNYNNNYYEILGVEINSSCEDIKRAYRKLSLIYHPDKNNSDIDKSNKFKIISDAYLTLSNNILRDKYNRENNLNQDYKKSELYTSKLEDMQPMQPMQPMHPIQPMHPMQHLQHINNNLYSYKLSNNSYFNIELPKPIEIIKEINYHQSYFGDNIPIIINRNISVNNEKYTENETIYINIEPGIDNNEIIILKEKGNITNNIIGDIKIKIKLLDDNNYKRKGLDIIYTKNISFKESICGFSFVLTHINGKTYTINNNTGIIINPNYTTSIPKLGFKKHDNIGNLIINYNIEYPDKLQQNIIKQLENIL